ncbi:MAG: Lrp/AsnC family transcriptional regulator [Myxococcales bacterium]|nr:Lrp/AsnC family transcriptional regulator [Myxococcales bacterium]
MPSRPLDDIDRALIAALRSDARRSHQSIAAALGVSEGTIRSRLKRLEADGVVRITTLQNIESLGASAFAYLWITCDRALLREIAGALAAQPLVGFVASLLGRADLLAIVQQDGPSELVRFVDDVVKDLPGVLDVRTEPILHLVKNDGRWGLVRARAR